MRVFVLTSVLVVSTPCLAALFVVNGDVNSGGSPTYNGPAVAPDSPTHFWNGLSPSGNTFPSSTLKASTSNGASDDTGITFTISHANQSLGTVDFGTSPPPPTATDLMRDIVYNRGSEGAESFSFNSVPAGNYDLYFYSVNGWHQSSTTLFTITTATFTTGGSGSATATNASASTFVLNNNYVLFGGLSPVGGVIAGTIFDASGTDAASSLNGFQLVSIPEPTAAVVSALAITAGALTRRRTR